VSPFVFDSCWQRRLVVTTAAVVLSGATPRTLTVQTFDEQVHPDLQAEETPPGLDEFLSKLAVFESGGDPLVVSNSGMLGKYQFSPGTLRHLGYVGSHGDFLGRESLQDSLMVVLLTHNRRALRGVLLKFAGTWKDDVLLTKSGLLAGAHLLGVGGVLAYVYPDRYSFPVVDGNGVHMSEYVREFGGYEFTLQ